MTAVTIDANLQEVRARIAAAAEAAGRAADAVTLLAVSKTQPAAAVLAALQAGQRAFGENYAQELRDKDAEVRALALMTGDLPPPRWHFIGPLQKNKVRLVVGRAALIHTVDDADLLDEIARRARAAGQIQECLVQVNIDAEPQKAGCAPAALAALLDRFASVAGARCVGLMCIPRAAPDGSSAAEAASTARPSFRALRLLLEREAQTPRDNVALRELSMGMSQDYAAAIAEGATLVRVGTAIFGARG